jgi:anti-sigma factor ChrR (cupin superfamily)
MNPRLALATLLPLALLGAGTSDAKPPAAASAAKAAASSHVMFDADGIKWASAPPALPKGAQMAVLAGDPDKAGPFTLRLKTPPGYKVALHWHPSEERVTVIQGDFHVQMGTGADAHAHTFAPGGYVVLPAHMRHAANTQGGTIVQIDSTGPFQIHYVNAKDDPRTAASGH